MDAVDLLVGGTASGVVPSSFPPPPPPTTVYPAPDEEPIPVGRPSFADHSQPRGWPGLEEAQSSWTAAGAFNSLLDPPAPSVRYDETFSPADVVGPPTEPLPVPADAYRLGDGSTDSAPPADLPNGGDTAWDEVLEVTSVGLPPVANADDAFGASAMLGFDAAVDPGFTFSEPGQAAMPPPSSFVVNPSGEAPLQSAEKAFDLPPPPPPGFSPATDVVPPPPPGFMASDDVPPPPPGFAANPWEAQHDTTLEQNDNSSVTAAVVSLDVPLLPPPPGFVTEAPEPPEEAQRLHELPPPPPGFTFEGFGGGSAFEPPLPSGLSGAIADDALDILAVTEGPASAPPPPPPGYGLSAGDISDIASTPAPPPPPPGFGLSAGDIASAPVPPPPPGFGIDQDQAAAPPPPPPGFGLGSGDVTAPPVSPGTMSGFAEDFSGGPGGDPTSPETVATWSVTEEDAGPPPITPDFFARAGRRRR